VKALGGVTEGDIDPLQLGPAAVTDARRRLHEEVQQRRGHPRAGDEQVATGAEPRQQRLGGK
jgi:hypothetical protein